MSRRGRLAGLLFTAWIAACAVGADRGEHRAALLIAAQHGDETAMRADVQAARDALLRRGFRSDEIMMIETCPDKETFRGALAKLEERISYWRNGSVFLYFSGHGTVRDGSLSTAEPAILFDQGELEWSPILNELARWRRIRFTLFADC